MTHLCLTTILGAENQERKMSQLLQIGATADGHNGLGTLRVTEYLGGGMFGFVMKAHDSAGHVDVAIKVPQVSALGSTELEAFRNEVMAASHIRHPNVVQVLHVGQQPTPYLVLEFVPGGTLKKRLDETKDRGEQVPLDLLEVWLQQLIDGMEAINATLLHRDVKPDNILIAADGSLKISDFGLAKIVGAATRPQSFKGGQHVYYMAPEGWRMESNVIQTDMYAIGIVMFEMCTLQFPYDLPLSDQRSGVFEKMHLYGVPKSARSIRGDIPIGMEQILVRLLNKRPDDRFPNWATVRSAVRDAFSTPRHGGGGSAASTAGAILASATAEHHRREASRSADEERRRMQNDLRDLHSYQREQLVKQFAPCVDEFNAHSQVGKARVDNRGNAVDFRFPHMVVTATFYDFSPKTIPLSSNDKRVIRFLALIENENDEGFNAVLIHRTPEDFHGTWEGWEMGVQGLVANPIDGRRHGDRFGFDDEQFYDEFRWSNGATHVYTYRRLTDMVARFAELAQATKKPARR